MHYIKYTQTPLQQNINTKEVQIYFKFQFIYLPYY